MKENSKRLKIYAARQNALAFLQIQKEFGSFSNYVWNFVDHKPIVMRRKSLKDIPASTPISDALSRDLKKRGRLCGFYYHLRFHASRWPCG